MDERYIISSIEEIWRLESKLYGWQRTELAFLQALSEKGGNLTVDEYEKIKTIWEEHPIDINWFRERDKEIRHDLNAFIDERLRWLDPSLQKYVHQYITSFDTEEPWFVNALSKSVHIALGEINALFEVLKGMANTYRFTIMNARTHGQEAELQTFGTRCLTWYKDIKIAGDLLEISTRNLKYSKMSGAIGKYGNINPKLEKRALELLALEPFYGATQIIPRILYVPVAEALRDVVKVIDKIATDIRLNARSGHPIMREPFAKKQKGSSAMPHKKNPITAEQLEGMARMASGFASMIVDNIKTWEERAIEQSCVERVAWPDLLHVTIHSIRAITRVLSSLQVYPDAMLEEIYESRGTYASGAAKEFLKKRLPDDMKVEDIYRIVQLASFNVFEPSKLRKSLRTRIPVSLEIAGRDLESMYLLGKDPVISIEQVISNGMLRSSESLDIDSATVDRYNEFLQKIFKNQGREVLQEWHEIFTPGFLLKHEEKLFKEILGEC